MKTTLEIDEGVMRRLKARAAEEGRTMSELVEVALRSLLGREEKAKPLPPLPAWDGGGWVADPADRQGLQDLLDAEDPLVQEMASWSKGV